MTPRWAVYAAAIIVIVWLGVIVMFAVAMIRASGFEVSDIAVGAVIGVLVERVMTLAEKRERIAKEEGHDEQP